MRIPGRLPTLFGFFCLLGVLALTATPAAGQKSTTRGLNLGFHLQGATLSVEGAEADGGGGGGIRVGYGLNRIVTVYFEADGVSVESEKSDVFQGTWALAHADIGVRFHFANALRSWVPYLDVAVGARGASVKDIESNGQNIEDITFNGGAFTVGGGIYVYFKETLALDVGLKFSGGQFTELDLGELSVQNLDIDAKSNRFKVGLVWWP